MALTEIYVDGSRPDDSGDGLTPATAKQLFASGVALCTDSTNGNRLNLQKDTDLSWSSTITVPRTASASAPMVLSPYNTAAGDYTDQTLTLTMPGSGAAFDASLRWTIRDLIFDCNANSSADAFNLSTRTLLSNLLFKNKDVGRMVLRASDSQSVYGERLDFENCRQPIVANWAASFVINGMRWYHPGILTQYLGAIGCNNTDGIRIYNLVYWLENANDEFNPYVFKGNDAFSIQLFGVSGFINSPGAIHVNLESSPRSAIIDRGLFEGGWKGYTGHSGSVSKVTNCGFYNVTSPLVTGPADILYNNTETLAASPFIDAANVTGLADFDSKMALSDDGLFATIPAWRKHDAGAIQGAAGAAATGGGGGGSPFRGFRKG